MLFGGDHCGIVLQTEGAGRLVDQHEVLVFWVKEVDTLN